MMLPPVVLLLATADWDSPLWTNKQYIARELSRDYDVIYVESLGLRRPELSRRDLVRIARRSKRAVQYRTSEGLARRPAPPKLTVVSPTVLPHHWGAARYINRRIINLKTTKWRELPTERRVLWSFTPDTYGLDRLASLTVYHCVDLMAEVYRIDRQLITLHERRLASAGVLAIASSLPVKQHLEKVGFHAVQLWPNVADAERFVGLATGESREPGLIVFGGNLTPQKIDLAYIRGIRRQVPQARIVAAGPIAEGGGPSKPFLAELHSMNVELVGPLSVDELAKLYSRASVGIIPYLRTPYTRGVFPMKLYEYLAAGLPVVTTPLPGLSPMPGDLWIEGNAQAFGRRVKSLLRAPSPDEIDRRKRTALNHSWEVRGAEARDLIARHNGRLVD